eukprot:g6060.t1
MDAMPEYEGDGEQPEPVIALDTMPGGHGPATLSLCAIVQDRARYLREWVAYHLVAGVDHIFLYDHGSVDDPQSAVAPFVKAGRVTVHSWRKYPARANAQGVARTHCFGTLGKVSKFLSMIDVDEFLFSRAGKNLGCVVDALMCDVDQLGVRWETWGDSGHIMRPKKGLVMDNFPERCKGWGQGKVGTQSTKYI